MTIEQLEEKMAPEEVKFLEIKKALEAQGRKVRRIQNKINKLKATLVLGDGDLTLEGIMRLEWHLLDGKLYKEVSNWLQKNLRYLWQSGYAPDAGNQVGLTIKMNRGHDVEPQIEEITRVINLTNSMPEIKRGRKKGEPNGPFKNFGMFVSSKTYEDDYSMYSFRVYKDGIVGIYRNRFVEEAFDTVDEALRYVHKRMWYEDTDEK